LSDIQTASVPTGDAELAQSEGVAEATNPVESGPVGEPSTETPFETLNVDDFKDYRVTVKVQGEDETVTLEEALRGFQRNADYTRKTQALRSREAELTRAEAFLTAFQTDPRGTLHQIADRMGLSLAEAGQVLEDQADLLEDADPLEQRLGQVESLLEQQKASEVQSHIEREFSDLHDTYGEFDDQAVITHALKTGVSVTDAFKLLNFDTVRTQASATSAEDAVLEAKRQAQIVEAGGKARTSAVGAAPTTGLSLRDSIAAAVRSARSAG
jgi:hypothetical protein